MTPCAMIGEMRNVMPASPDRFFWRVDASEHRRQGIVGIGMVLYRLFGEPTSELAIARCSEAYFNVIPGLGELLAVVRALQLSKEMNIREITVSSDNRHVAKSVPVVGYSNVPGATLIDRIIQRACVSLERVDITYLRRNRNGAADRLARIAAGEGEARLLPPDLAEAFQLTGPTRSSHHFRTVAAHVSDTSNDGGSICSIHDDDPIPF